MVAAERDSPAGATAYRDCSTWIYYYNYFDGQTNIFGSGVHEGDWEMIQIRLDASNNPDLAVYAQHDGSELCPWSQVTQAGAGRPLDFPQFNVIHDNSPSWVTWPGKWGDSDASPAGPIMHGSQWTDPSGWVTAPGSRGCDVA